MVGHLRRVERLVRDLSAVLFRLKARRRAETFDLPAHPLDQLRSAIEQRKLDRGRPGIEGENMLHCSAASERLRANAASTNG